MKNPIHEQKDVVFAKIVKFEADKEIVPLLKWLNDHHGVTTQYSCQGVDGTNGVPYVQFICDEMDSMKAICSIFSMFDITGSAIKVSLNYYYPWEPCRFMIKFKSLDKLKEFISFIEKFPKGPCRGAIISDLKVTKMPTKRS